MPTLTRRLPEKPAHISLLVDRIGIIDYRRDLGLLQPQTFPGTTADWPTIEVRFEATAD